MAALFLSVRGMPQRNIAAMNVPLTLSKAAAADAEAILAIGRASFSRPQEMFNRRQIRYLLRSPHAVAFVARARGGETLGWAVGLIRRRDGLTWGRIYALAVHPRARGAKLGRRLMDRTIQSLRRGGAQKIFLEVRDDNAPALALYRAMDFVPRRSLPDYYGRGVHGLQMVLDMNWR